MGRHTVMLEVGELRPKTDGESPLLAPSREESEHAVRVKRVVAGDRVTLLDGAGTVGVGVVEAVRPHLLLRVESSRRVEPVAPRVEVWSATPKGPRLEDMIDQLSQVGAASWRPLETEYGVVEPGEHKMDRCRRVARESAKQCGRAWVMEIGDEAALDDAVRAPTGVLVVVADAHGVPWSGAAHGAGQRGVRVLVGPEGGFSSAELNRAEAAGATPVRFGPHVLRIETAAVCAAARIVGG